jgi:hypothetical protein
MNERKNVQVYRRSQALVNCEGGIVGGPISIAVDKITKEDRAKRKMLRQEEDRRASKVLC